MTQSRTRPIVIRKDARETNVTDAHLQEQYGFARKIGDTFSRTSDLVVRIRRLKAQIADRVASLTDSPAILSAAEPAHFLIFRVFRGDLPRDGFNPLCAAL